MFQLTLGINTIQGPAHAKYTTIRYKFAVQCASCKVCVYEEKPILWMEQPWQYMRNICEIGA